MRTSEEAQVGMGGVSLVGYKAEMMNAKSSS